jgi:carboxyl-terminal processing protease
MYVEDVNINKVQNDLVLGMYNYLRPMSLYQHDSVFHLLELKPSEKTSLGMTVKFNKGRILIDSIFPNSGAFNAQLKNKDQIIGIDNNKLNEVYYYSDFYSLSLGDENSISNLTLIREKDTLNIDVKRLKIPNHSVIPIPNSLNANSINSYEEGLKLFDLIYPDTITNSEITEHGIRFMLEQLDPHSTYISLKDLHDMNAPLKGSFTGVGIRFQIFKDTVLIVQAIPGGPSEKVGLMAGDKIIKIGEEMVAGIGMKNSGVRDRLLGDKGTKVLVGVKRGNSNEIIDFEITRDKIPIYSVDASYMANENTGYIKLNNFSSTSISEIRKAVFSLKNKGMKNLILDLQNNGGGYLKTAVDLADEMLPGNRKIVSTKGRKFPEKIYGGNNKGLLENGKIIVLVNESSASASEIVSGAIQDWDRGLIVGRRTFGKGLVQKPIQLPDGTQVRITTSKYYTPSGRCIQKSYSDGSMAYRKEKYSRYKSGESFNKDSIKNNENEVYSTLLKNRKVYGGGGVVPDIFVPLDTNGTSAYFSKLIRKGVFNQFSLYYVNKNRDNLEKKYSNFEKYKTSFNTKNALQELIEFAKDEGINFNEKQYNESKKTIEVRLKANIAQDLYDYKKFYEIINELNITLQKSLVIINNDKAFSNLVE